MVVLGAGGFAVEVADLAADAGFDVVGFVEGLDRERCAEPLDGLPVHWIDDLPQLARGHVAVCGVGAPEGRRRLVAAADACGLRFEHVVHPAAHVSLRAELGEGTVVSPGAVIAARATLGRHVLVNRGAMVGHHTTVGAFTSLMTGANIAGTTVVGEGVYVGMGALVLNGLTVGREATIAAGAVVTRDVESSIQVRGLPARPVLREATG
jgi:sugar O-acyltransferase (sialic acid O-acetyltransferase NeuD family)